MYCGTLFSAALSKDANVRLKQQILAILDEFLREEAERMIVASKEHSTLSSIQSASELDSTLEKKIQMTDQDTGVAGLVFQQFLPDILNGMYDTTPAVRLSAVKLVMLILKRSLVHPIQCVEHLVAVQGDHVRSISEHAYHCLLNVHSKDSKIISTRLSNGIVCSYKYQKEAFNSWKVVADASTDGLSEKESVFGKLYSMFKTAKTSRHSFLHTLVRLYESEATNFDFLKYLTMAISILPFSWQDDILYIIYHLNRIISFSGASLLSTLKEVYGSKKSGKKSSGEVTAPSEIRQAVGIIYALRLKQFLKTYFGISGALCKNYDPATVSDNKLAPLSAPIVELNDATSLVNLDGIQGNWWDDYSVCKKLFSTLKEDMDSDENDFSSVISDKLANKTREKKGKLSNKYKGRCINRCEKKIKDK